jgi:hypothetical protein
VWADGRHLIAKEYLTDVEPDAPLNEYRALRLVESMDIAPQPLFFDPSVGPVVVYQYLDGTMWDRRVPAAAELAALADLWVALHALPIEDVWFGRRQAPNGNSPTLVALLRAPIERYDAWAAQRGMTRDAWLRVRARRRSNVHWLTVCRSSEQRRQCASVGRMRGSRMSSLGRMGG